jgi:hypothetical protein
MALVKVTTSNILVNRMGKVRWGAGGGCTEQYIGVSIHSHSFCDLHVQKTRENSFGLLKHTAGAEYIRSGECKVMNWVRNEKWFLFLEFLSKHTL